MSPPSTRKVDVDVSRTAATMSATLQAIPSSAARATLAPVVPPWMPEITAPAFGATRAPEARQARKHPSAGRIVGLPGQLAQGGRVLSQVQLLAQPLEHRAGREHAAVERVLGAAVDPPRDRRQQPAGRLRDLVADVGKHEDAGAVRRLDEARGHAARPSQGRLLVGLAAERKLGRPRVVAHRSEVAGRVEHVREHLGGNAEPLAQPGVEPGLAQRVQLGARGRRLVGGEAGPEPVAEVGVDRADTEGPGVARAATPSSFSSSQAIFAAEK